MNLEHHTPKGGQAVRFERLEGTSTRLWLDSGDKCVTCDILDEELEQWQDQIMRAIRARGVPV